MLIHKYDKKDISQMIDLWNEVVEDGIAFPQEELLNEETGAKFFASQSYCGVAIDDSGKVVGLYILHPNNVGRCGHICNASYAVSSRCRGRHIGEKLVLDCIVQAKEIGFKILQFNAVVESNIHARRGCRKNQQHNRTVSQKLITKGLKNILLLEIQAKGFVDIFMII